MLPGWDGCTATPGCAGAVVDGVIVTASPERMTTDWPGCSAPIATGWPLTMSDVLGVTRNAWLLSRMMTCVPGSTRITRPVTSAVWAIAAVVIASVSATTRLDIDVCICRRLLRSSNRSEGSKDAATHCRSRRPDCAVRRNQIASDRENRQPEAHEHIGDARCPARKVTGVQARDAVPHAEPRLGRLFTRHATGLAVDDHRAGRRLDTNGVAIVGDERGDPGSGQRLGGARGDDVQPAQI